MKGIQVFTILILHIYYRFESFHGKKFGKKLKHYLAQSKYCNVFALKKIVYSNLQQEKMPYLNIRETLL